jgi:sirohydrochlorin cobaltochelatase
VDGGRGQASLVCEVGGRNRESSVAAALNPFDLCLRIHKNHAALISAKPHCALVIVGHGSTVNADSSAPTYDHAAEIARRGLFGEVHCAFWKEEPSLRQVLHMIDADEIYVVPNFISEGYFTRTVIPRELELTGPVTHRDGRTIKYCDPVGNHPRMTELLLQRAAEVAPGVPPQETSLLIVGHGTDLNDNSATAAKREVQRIAERGIYAEVLNAYMEEEPLIARWDEITRQLHVVVVPFFISDGLHSYEDIPVLLGIAEESRGAASTTQKEIFRHNPYRRRNRLLYYASAIGTEPQFADVLLEQVAAFDAARATPAPSIA